MSIGRKVFHCVVDDTALTVNISEIKKWTAQGAITLIVPLYTLERLRALKKAGSQIGMNAREAVRFLDRVTSGKHNIPASKVVLQGPMEQFVTWEEAERYFLPEYQEVVEKAPVGDAGKGQTSRAETKSPRNGNDKYMHTEDLNEMSQMLLSKLNFKKEPDTTSANSGGTRSFPTSPLSGSSRASPEYSISRLEDNEAAEDDDESNTQYVIPPVPDSIKPLLNAILWRLHAQSGPSTTPSSCILVTNDRTNQTWAQKFGITVKTVPQLRTSIIYEEKEFKNHCKYLEKNAANQTMEPKTLLSYEDESDEDVLVFVPRGHSKSRSDGKPTMNESRKSTGTSATNGQVNGSVKVKELAAAEPGVEVPTVPIDPDSFSRNIGPRKQQQKVLDLTSTNNVNRGVPRHIPRAGGGRRGGPRGGLARGGSTRGRGKLWVP
ncbi:hypothetical protein VTO42DRAFT_7663 [Malbranchea cinnamomea]